MKLLADLRVTSVAGGRGLLARWLPVIVWMALIFTFSAQPTLPSLPGAFWDTLMKKGAHFTVYAVLAALSWRALEPRRGAFGWAWLLAVLYACTDEWHQSFVPGRHPMATDVLIDACGAATALLLIWLAQRRWRNG
jgi:VanZ family protein